MSKKISELTALTAPASGDYVPIVDISEALDADKTKRITLAVTGGARGTSMPSSPATGDRFFRTDLGFECYYDGTRWLTTNVFTINDPRYEELSASFGLGWNIVNDDYDIYIMGWGAYIGMDTADASNRWELEIKSGAMKLDKTTISSALDGDMWVDETTHVFASPPSYFELYCTKVGSPASLGIGGLQIHYRQIIT